MIRILTEPKNAIIKQYKKFFDLDKVELVFTAEALEQTAEQALAQKTGARGLRTIIEETLLDIMYEIPSRNDIKSCTITDKVILKQESPILEPSTLPTRGSPTTTSRRTSPRRSRQSHTYKGRRAIARRPCVFP